MSFAQPSWSLAESTERPMILTLRLSNSGLIFAMYPSSVVQTVVKSFGCEKSTAQESPIHSWKWMRPSVVSASKSGAVSPICSAIFLLLLYLAGRRYEATPWPLFRATARSARGVAAVRVEHRAGAGGGVEGDEGDRRCDLRRLCDAKEQARCLYRPELLRACLADRSDVLAHCLLHHRRARGADADAVDMSAGRELRGEVDGQPEQARLRRGVRGVAVAAAKRGDAPDEDDGAPVAERRRQGTRQEERPAEIRRDERIERFAVRLGERQRRLPTQRTDRPRLASACAVARPIPLPAPV